MMPLLLVSTSCTTESKWPNHDAHSLRRQQQSSGAPYAEGDVHQPLQNGTCWHVGGDANQHKGLRNDVHELLKLHL